VLSLFNETIYSKCHVTSNKVTSKLECAEDKFQTRGWVQETPATTSYARDLTRNAGPCSKLRDTYCTRVTVVIFILYMKELLMIVFQLHFVQCFLSDACQRQFYINSGIWPKQQISTTSYSFLSTDPHIYSPTYIDRRVHI
jgi:hypothetical protein